ncbi:sensor histidine kinase [Microbulbifer yueqingensis]|uniref:Two-component system, LytT family, sensor histidine kinase AlgZ n=1 Tax=Microbulbifer yueqingensis TaxID=658219 RepID=A0A1G9EEJ9_9GAMM|nr:histidine kinase [Microbulbifer yueqingensis]SDK74518.1 two-component system, LytT family, sensor histidine kinase AlgZ [Microbulbifer yueqingensis]
MTSPQPARPAGIIAQQIRETAPEEKDSAYPQFLPDLCGVSAVAVLVMMGELLAVVLVLAVDGLREFSWQRLGLFSLTAQWVILPAAALLCRLRPRLARLPRWRAGATSFAVVLAVLATVMLVQQWWQARLSGEPLDLWALAGNLLLGAICAGVVLRYAYVQQQLRNQQRAELGARIEALQSRMRPHFLFNSLNSLASLIAVDPDRAERLVEELSALFRASLAEPRMVTLAQELALARRYMEIEALRLGPRLRLEWQVDESLADTPVPSMLLQPLLENAVLHGVARLRGGGCIRVEVTRHGRQLALSIENPLAGGEEPTARGGNGMALENTRQRLAAHYPQGFRLDAAADGDRYRVEVALPLSPGQGQAAGGVPA